MKIGSATFLASANSIDDSVKIDRSEVVFLGRSNVGKSSLINALTRKHNLAKSSSTPGKTKLINFFDVTILDGDAEYFLRFVDLPGFGYAKVSKAVKHQWEYNLTQFLKERPSIRLFIQLIDARHFDLQNDIDVYGYITRIIRKDQVFLTVFTKIDKLNQSEKSKLTSYIHAHLDRFVHYAKVSSVHTHDMDVLLHKVTTLTLGQTNVD